MSNERGTPPECTVADTERDGGTERQKPEKAPHPWACLSACLLEKNKRHGNSVSHVRSEVKLIEERRRLISELEDKQMTSSYIYNQYTPLEAGKLLLNSHMEQKQIKDVYIYVYISTTPHDSDLSLQGIAVAERRRLTAS